MKLNKLDIQAALDVSSPTLQRYIKHPNWPKGAPTGSQNALEWDVNELPEVLELATKKVEVRQQVISYLQYKGVSNSEILGIPEPEALEDEEDVSWVDGIPLPEIPKPPQVSHEEVEALEEKMLHSTSKAARDKARKRGDVCRAILKLRKQGYGKEEAIKMVSGPGQSRRAICDWLKKVDGQQPQYFDALLFKDYPTEKPIKKPFSLAARRRLCILYFRPEKPSMAACYRELEKLAKENDWQIPGLKMAERYLNKVKNNPEWILARDGREALERMYPHLKRTKDDLRALSAVVADGHTLDLKCVLPSGNVGRPILVAWMDVKSNKILSYRLAETENQHVIRESFSEVLKNYGIPERVYLDNGRAFANKAMSGGIPHRYRFKVQENDFMGLFSMVDTDVTWARPYHGQSKTIERAWGTLISDIAKHPNAAGAYTGRSPENKPFNYGERVLEWSEVLEIVDQGILSYNALEGRRGEGMDERSFNEVFEESYKSSSIRKATKAQIYAWSLMAKKVKVSKVDGSITIDGRKYWPKEHLSLLPYCGKEIVVSYDFHDPLADVRFETLDRTFIGLGKTFESEFFNPEGAAEIGTIRNSGIKQADKKLKKALNTLDGEEVIPVPKLKAPPIPQAGIIAHDFKGNKTKAKAKEQEIEEVAFTDFDRTMSIMRAVNKANLKAL